jgi:hypothetical protein
MMGRSVVVEEVHDYFCWPVFLMYRLHYQNGVQKISPDLMLTGYKRVGIS